MSGQVLPRSAVPASGLAALLAQAVMGSEHGAIDRRRDAPAAPPPRDAVHEPDRDAEDMAFLRRLREAGL